MHTLGSTTSPHQWESFHPNKSFCLVRSEVNKRNHSTLFLVKVGQKPLIARRIFWKEMNFPIKCDSTYCQQASPSVGMAL